MSVRRQLWSYRNYSRRVLQQTGFGQRSWRGTSITNYQLRITKKAAVQVRQGFGVSAFCVSAFSQPRAYSSTFCLRRPSALVRMPRYRKRDVVGTERQDYPSHHGFWFGWVPSVGAFGFFPARWCENPFSHLPTAGIRSRKGQDGDPATCGDEMGISSQQGVRAPARPASEKKPRRPVFLLHGRGG